MAGQRAHTSTHTDTHTDRFWADYRLHRCFCFPWPLHPFFVITLSIPELCCPSLRPPSVPLGRDQRLNPTECGSIFIFHHRVQHKYAQYSQSVGPAPAVCWALEAHSHVIVYNQLGLIRSFVSMRSLGSDRYRALSGKRLC